MTTATAIATVAEIREMITAPSVAAPADDLIACIAACELEDGHTDLCATLPALGMEIAVICVPSKTKTVLRAVTKIADINEKMSTGDIAKSDAVVDIVDMLARIDRNAKQMDVAPAPRKHSAAMEAALDAALAKIEETMTGTVATTDSRYIVDRATGSVSINPEIPESIAAIMPEIWTSLDGVGTCPTMDIPAGWEDAAEIEIEAAERNIVEIMQILGIEEA